MKTTLSIIGLFFYFCIAYAMLKELHKKDFKSIMASLFWPVTLLVYSIVLILGL